MKRILLFTAIVMAISFNINAQNQVTNGDFETGDKSGWSGFNNGVTLEADEAGSGIDFCYEGTTSGKINNAEGSLFQVINLVSGKTYTVSFWGKLRDADQSFNATAKDEVTSGKPVIGSVEVNSTSWTNYTYDIVAPADGQVRILFYKPNGIGPFYVDNIDVREAQATAIGKTPTTQLVVSPNPSTGLFKVKADEAIAAYSVYNAAGQVVKSAKVNLVKELTIDLTGHNDGLYMVQVESDKGAKTVSKLLLK